MAIITINGNSLDTSAPTLRAFGLASETAQGSNYILLQTDGPLTKEVKQELAAKQVVLQEKVSDDTYLCGYKPQDLSEIRGLPFVKYANVYQSHFVVESRLKGTPAASSATHPLLPEPSNTTHPVDVDVQFHPDVEVTPELIKALAAAARLDEDLLETEGHKVRITVQRRYLSDLADVDEVKSIHQVHPIKLHNNIARTILRIDQVTNHADDATPYQGDGQIVCVADTGFDKGSLAPSDVHAAFKDSTTNKVRVQALVSLGRRDGSASDPDGHGTHVCGSVLGDATSATTGDRIQGTAPKATLVMQSLLAARGGLSVPANLNDLFLPAYAKHGARIHTNSWGSAPEPFFQIAYNDESKEIDSFVHAHRAMVILFAAGNDGMDTAPSDGRVDPAQIGSQAAAKNCISVGASESVRPNFNIHYSQFGYPKQPLASDKVANSANGMAAFSSRGPTVEGRIKPDVVAPGTCILSALSSKARDSGGWGTSPDPTYMFLGGTSMATPLVAGCCAVLREALIKNGIASPSAALIKALLINGAVELQGQYTPSEAGKSPNEASGWGRVDVANSVVVIPAEVEAGEEDRGIKRNGDGTAGFRDEVSEEGLDTFDEFSFKVAVSENKKGATLKVTLVWTDPAGEKLQNDLDLIVVAPGGETERHGNKGSVEYPVKTKKQRDEEERATPSDGHDSEPFDRRNNVEQVVWEGVPEGDFVVVVRVHNVTTLGGQTFAVTWRVY